MINPWPYIQPRNHWSFHVFSIRTDTIISPRTRIQHDFYVIEPRHWINVIPLTKDHQVVMIRQYRHESRTVTLEISRELLDSGDTPEIAAGWELLEETGYRAKK